MGDIVLEYLNRADPRGTFIGDLGFTTNTHDGGVIVQAIDEGSQGVRSDPGVGVDLPY